MNYRLITKWRVTGSCPVLWIILAVESKYFERRRSTFHY